MLEAATDEPTMQRLAEIALAESPSRLLVEVREEDRLLFSIDRNGVACPKRLSLLYKFRFLRRR